MASSSRPGFGCLFPVPARQSRFAGQNLILRFADRGWRRPTSAATGVRVEQRLTKGTKRRLETLATSVSPCRDGALLRSSMAFIVAVILWFWSIYPVMRNPGEKGAKIVCVGQATGREVSKFQTSQLSAFTFIRPQKADPPGGVLTMRGGSTYHMPVSAEINSFIT